MQNYRLKISNAEQGVIARIPNLFSVEAILLLLE